jgi:hypothetical protein
MKMVAKLSLAVINSVAKHSLGTRKNVAPPLSAAEELDTRGRVSHIFFL